VLDLIDREVKGRQGERTDLVDNIHEVDNVNESSRPSGTSSAAALRRLHCFESEGSADQPLYDLLVLTLA
jgi:hypothetical protein